MGRLLGGALDIVERRPIDYYDWLPGQLDYLSCQDRFALLRSGNQWFGKTTVGIADQLWWARGEHPYRPASSHPVTGWIVSSSEQQSGVLAGKLDAMCPEHWLHPDSVYQPTKGHYRGKYPRVGIRHVSGGWSWLYFRWTGQRSLNLASATLNGVLFDEPPSNQRAYREVERRLTRTGGDLRMTFTPVNAPIDYLKKATEEGTIRDLHYPLKPEALVPVGRSAPLLTEDGIPMDEAWIKDQRRLVMGWEGAVVLDGEWEFRATGSVFTAWDPALHVTKGPIGMDPRCPSGDLKLCLGIDWGDNENRMIAVLMAVDDRGQHPIVLVLDEYVSSGKTTLEQDEQGILTMLDRNGYHWRQLHSVHGDKRYAGQRGGLTTKSNSLLTAAVARRLSMPTRHLQPPVRSAKRGKGSGKGAVHFGARWLHEAMVRRGHFLVDPRCEVVIEAIGRWDYGEPFKDPIDAVRYGCKPWIMQRRRIAAPTLKVY